MYDIQVLADFDQYLTPEPSQIILSSCHRTQDPKNYNDPSISLGQGQLEELQKHWDDLYTRTIDKGEKLNEASRQQRFNTGIRDFEFWLSEVIAPGNGGDMGATEYLSDKWIYA